MYLFMGLRYKINYQNLQIFQVLIIMGCPANMRKNPDIPSVIWYLSYQKTARQRAKGRRQKSVKSTKKKRRSGYAYPQTLVRGHFTHTLTPTPTPISGVRCIARRTYAKDPITTSIF